MYAAYKREKTAGETTRKIAREVKTTPNWKTTQKVVSH
jgi:hypothetical protein